MNPRRRVIKSSGQNSQAKLQWLVSSRWMRGIGSVSRPTVRSSEFGVRGSTTRPPALRDIKLAPAPTPNSTLRTPNCTYSVRLWTLPFTNRMVNRLNLL